MTPKEKAEELVNKYETLGKDFTRGVSMKEFSKQCALIAVDELISDAYNNYFYNYWQEVKNEIEKL